MSALMSDVVLGDVDPHVAGTSIAAGNAMIRAVELSYRYGKRSPEGKPPTPIRLIA